MGKQIVIEKDGKKITPEEQTLLDMYRKISRWERNYFFMILQSVAYGPLTPKTDKYSWNQIRRISDLPQSGKAVRHG